jgi:hypothetical protein
MLRVSPLRERGFRSDCAKRLETSRHGCSTAMLLKFYFRLRSFDALIRPEAEGD